MSRAREIEQGAALWVLRRDEADWSASDQAELDSWLEQSDANKVAFWRLDHGWREADRIAALGTPPETDAPRFAVANWWQPLALAASLLLVFAVLFVQRPSLTPGASPEVAALQFQTAVGGHKVVQLPDGSRAELNTDTAIRAVIHDGGRAVWLDRGEVFFDVAKRQGQAFVIYAGQRTITVLGTKFSVRRSGPEMVVAVAEGRVRVDEAPANGRARQATVSAGDLAISRGRSTLVESSAQAVQQQLAWRNGLLEFDRATLADAAEEFNRYNHKQLVIGDAEAAQLIVAGSFRARNLDSFIRWVGDAYGLGVKDSAARVVVSAPKLASRGPLKQLRPELLPRARHAVEEIADECGPGAEACEPIANLPPVQPALPIQEAKRASVKAVRDAKNWHVLHKLYPPRALSAGEEGLVGFKVKIDSSGNPTECAITHTSGFPLLDLETCQLIMVHAVFKRPNGISLSQQRAYEGVVNWKLPSTPLAAVPAAPKPIDVAAAPEKLICKRARKTGSHAAFERICMTQRDWERSSDENKGIWQEQQGKPPR
jgi:transmembrane sensor